MCKNREKRLSGVEQLGKTLFSGIIAAMLSTTVMAGGDQLAENPNFKLIKKESGAPITAIAVYDNDRSAICADSDGNIYCVSNGSYWKVTNAKARIDSIIIGDVFTGDFCFTAGGKAFAYKGNNVIDISENFPGEIKRLYRNDESPKIYAVTGSDDIYTLSDDGSLKWEAAATETAEKILDDISASKDSDKGVGHNNVSSYGKNFTGTQNGQIYASSNYDRGNMTVKADYVSDAVNDTDNVIYRIIIKGCRLNAEDIFIKGYNGFKYTLSSNGKYNKYAYPIAGVIYDSDGRDGATLQMREISFLWLGPKCTKDGDHKLSVNEVAYNFSTGKEESINKIEISLPAAEQLSDYSNYNISIKIGEGVAAINTESNGTCGKPFNILIKDGEGNVLEEDDDAYNHLVFYTADGSSVKKDGLIGCDLENSKSDYMAIIPADKVEVDGKYVKYGIIGKTCKTSGGKTFYAYVKADGLHNVSAGLVYMNDLTSNLSTDFTVNGTKGSVTISPNNPNINVEGGRTFELYAQGVPVSGSNWQGNEWGFGGYLDYELTGYKNDLYKGVFVYLPEGLNTRNLEDRKNLSKLTIGYYFDPQVDRDNPMLATNYHINDTSSYCDKMRKQYLYAMLFDQYGRFATYNIQDTDDAKDLSGKNLWVNREKGLKSDWNDTLNMVWEVGNLYNAPIIMGCPKSDLEYNKKVKYGITNRGLFVPPITSGVNATFLSDISVWIHGKDKLDNNNLGKYKIAGYKFDVCPDKSMLFFNSLEIKDLNGSSSISLNVTNYSLRELQKWPELIMSNSDVTSVNRINIKNPGTWVSDWLDVWSVIHLPTDLASNYAYHYDLYYNKKEVKPMVWEYRFTDDGNYVVEQGEGSVINYPMQGKWVSDEYHKYGCNTCIPFNTVPTKPASAWPITRN